MKNFRHLLLLMFLGTIVSLGSYAQDDESSKYRKKDQEQLDKYKSGDYLFPPEPKNNWSIGIKGGLAFVAGDVSSQPGFGGAIDIRKALGHVFGLRLQLAAGQMNGLNYQATRGYVQGASAGNPWAAPYAGTPPEAVFYNHRTNYGDVGLQGVFNLNNINFYKEQAKWNLYVGLGLGASFYSTKIDALNGVDTYNFSSVDAIALNGDNSLFSIGGRRERIDELKSILDGVYESEAEGYNQGTGVELGDNRYKVNPMINGSYGLRYRLSRRVELELEHRLAWTNDDLIDGQRWTEGGGGLTSDYDVYQNITLGIHFRLGKGEESLWWTNPLTETYKSARDARQLVEQLQQDSDDDGVPDLYDKDPDTPPDYMVDVNGVPLDSDGDGIPDSEDAEPFSPKGCDTDSQGRAKDSDDDGVPDCFDKEPNSPPGMYYDSKGVAIQMPEQPSAVPCLLPVIHFELDKSDINTDFYPELYYVAQVMRANPDVKVRATGHADVRNTDEYNRALSQRRVDNAVDFIVNTYKIDRTRFVIDAKGENAPLIEDLPDTYRTKLEPLQYVNRRVEFECVEE